MAQVGKVNDEMLLTVKRNQLSQLCLSGTAVCSDCNGQGGEDSEDRKKYLKACRDWEKSHPYPAEYDPEWVKDRTAWECNWLSKQKWKHAPEKLPCEKCFGSGRMMVDIPVKLITKG